MGPSILFQLSPGVTVSVWFDASSNTLATFLGVTGNTATFLIGAQVVFIALNRIQAVAIP